MNWNKIFLGMWIFGTVGSVALTILFFGSK